MKKTLLLLLLLTSARAEDRLALLIGNANYEIQPLNNPINDVRGLKTTLEALNFKVRLLENGSLGEMEAAINDFGRDLQAHPNSTALFYYSGHGQELGGKNYLLPLHSIEKIYREEHFKDKAISSDYVLSTMKPSRFRFFFLDACRTLDFPNLDGGKSLAKGLAPINGAGSNTLIFYATELGKIALDGNGKNSPFARALMQRLAEPLSLPEMVRLVTDDVATATHDQQIPWSSSSLRTPFYFKKPSGDEAPARLNPARAETAVASSKSEVLTGIAPAQSETATANTPSKLSAAEQEQILKEADAAYDKENYARALELYQRLAAAGHAWAMKRLGLMYEYGHGVAEDYASAQRWYEKTGDAGDSAGYYLIGRLYKEGVGGIEKNWATAKRWFEKAGDAGDRDSYAVISRLYEQGGPGLEQDLVQACHYYQKASPFYVEEAKKVCPR